MRERKDLDKGRLPASTYQLWLGQQSSTSAGRIHRAPPPDTYEAWLDKLTRDRTARERRARR